MRVPVPRAVRPWLALAAAPLLACGSPPPPAPLSPAAAPAPAPPPPSFDQTWDTFHSERFELLLPFPDGHGWRIDDHRTPWLSATHAATDSQLVVRSWTEDGRATRQRCEERARLWRTFPDPARAESVDARSIDAPSGFDTFVSIGVVAGKTADEPVSGFAVAFGGHGHRCFAWAYTTSARGAGAEAVLGARLAAMVDRSLGRAVIESRLAPRIDQGPRIPKEPR